MDMAIPSLKINIEHDRSGARHMGWRRAKDMERDSALGKLGWLVLRYRDCIPDESELRKTISAIEANHEGKYALCEWEISKIRYVEYHKNSRRTEKLWDIEVEDDHSYVAEGVVSHNCQCALHEFVGTMRGKIETGPGGDIIAEETHIYGVVKPKIKDQELADALSRVQVRMDGIPIEELR